MSGPNGETMYVLPMPPRRATRVRCPECGLGGWFDDDDPEPMVCPYCGVNAEVIPQ